MRRIKMKNTEAKKPLIVLTAGGTGGHVYPAESLAEELERRGYDLMLITDCRGKDNYKGKLGQIPNVAVFSGGIVGKSKLFKLQSLCKTCVGIIQAMFVLLKKRPVCVVGFGGYASFPASVAALLLGIDLVLHEQNSVMSRTNRYLCKYAALIAQSFRNVKNVPVGAKSILCGMPVRANIAALADKTFTPPKEEKFQIVVLGGSQGAKIFGEVVPQAIQMLSPQKQKLLKIFQQCRKGEEKLIEKKYENTESEIVVSHFFENMAELYAGTHLIISRSGASSVSEIAVAAIPSVLVPLPTAADDHQTSNTKDLLDAGGAVVLRQDEFAPEKLKRILEDLMQNGTLLIKMSANARKVGIKDAARRFADAIEKEVLKA